VGTPARILAFDSSSSRSVCGVVEGQRAISSRVSPSPLAPSEGLLPMIHACLEEAGVGLADIDAVVPGLGPGSFTGTRIALSTAKGIALGSGIRLVAVSSLEAAAIDTGWTAGPVAVALDARKGEVLLGAYLLDAAASACMEPTLVAPDALPARLRSLARNGRVRVVGDAASTYPDAFAGAGLDVAPPDTPLISSPASLAVPALARLARGESDDPDALEPVYSRPPPVHAAAGPARRSD
jgi:tRNA threonylcarbamoyl adenosine modification protein YeaZ